MHNRFSNMRFIAVCLCICAAIALHAQAPNPSQAAPDKDRQLKFVVIVSRHGVRSPTAKPGQFDPYSRQPWPVWSVPPGYLTEHGARLMTIFGAFDREQLAAQGLLAPTGCDAAEHIRIVADSDQRTRETANALAAGLAPGCSVPVTALPEGTPDPLFHSIEAKIGQPDKLLATAAVSGRIGANPREFAEAYRPQLEALEAVLQSCPTGVPCSESKTPTQSIFDIPASIAPGKKDHLVEFRSPLSVASTMSENLLLEYTEGMEASKVGWGRVDGDKLREILQLHTASEGIVQRTSYIARAQSSNLLLHLLQSMQQAVDAHPVTGALTQPGDRLLILVGHDTNLANIGGALSLSWLIDGRRDDTPPGGALVFELWKRNDLPAYSVHVYYTAQTLDQMRNATPLSLKTPPERVPVFVPGCSQADQSCDWAAFEATLKSAIETEFTK